MKPSTSACVAAILLTVSFASADRHKRFALADLKSLIEQKSYQEALQHLGDISPSERKAEWQDLAGQAAVGVVQGGEDEISQLAMMIEIEHQYPIVIKNAKYNALRTEVGPKGFDVCWNNGDPQTCFDYAKKFIADDPTNGKLALAIAKSGRRGMNAYSAVPLFKLAMTANKGNEVCKDDDLRLAVTAALGLSPDDGGARTGREIATSCWSDVRKAVIAELGKGDAGSYYKSNACQVAQTRHENTAQLCADAK